MLQKPPSEQLIGLGLIGAGESLWRPSMTILVMIKGR